MRLSAYKNDRLPPLRQESRANGKDADGNERRGKAMNDETIMQMRDRHEKEINLLQNNCPHPVSRWRQNMWAPAHYDGEVRVCQQCGKIMETRP